VRGSTCPYLTDDWFRRIHGPCPALQTPLSVFSTETSGLSGRGVGEGCATPGAFSPSASPFSSSATLFSPSAPPSQVVKPVVTSENIKLAAASRRSQGHVAQYTCSWPGCDTSFTTKFKMHCHIKAHQGIKDFVCSLPGCDKAFVRKSDLRRHEKQTQHPQPHPAGISGLSVASAGHSPFDGFYYPFNE
jgi:hypothetical protein